MMTMWMHGGDTVQYLFLARTITLGAWEIAALKTAYTQAFESYVR